MIDLLNCPFCGGAPEDRWSNSTTKHFIQCERCGARTSINLASHGGSARDEWNRRVPVSALESARAEAAEIENDRLIADAQAAWSKHGGTEIALGQWKARAEAAEIKLKTQFNQHVDDLAKARGESEADKQSIADLTDRAKELEEEVANLRAATNQSRLAFSGMVSVQSAIDLLDKLGGSNG